MKETKATFSMGTVLAAAMAVILLACGTALADPAAKSEKSSAAGKTEAKPAEKKAIKSQSDALLDMLTKKGLLTPLEADTVRDDVKKLGSEGGDGRKIKVGGWLDELKLSGDARVRYEQFWDRQLAGTAGGGGFFAAGTTDEQDRTRYRYRLRFGLEARAGDWNAGFRLASGDAGGPAADPVSTMTTFTNWGSKKAINVDLAYIKYTPGFIDVGQLVLTGGKMENPFWETDMVFDPDLTPESFAEQYKYKFNDSYSVFANLGQWALFENNTTGTDPAPRGKDTYMFGYQVGHQWGIVPKKLDLKQAVAFYDYSGIYAEQGNPATLTNNTTQNNTLDRYFGNSVLQSQFEVFTLNNEVRLGYWEKYPIRLQGEYMHNFGTNLDGGQSYFADGYKVGGILGDAKKKGDWQIGYWYELLQANANPGLFSDSDFGFGGTNNKGHIIKAAYNLTDWASLGVAYWNVVNIEDVLNNGALGVQANTRTQSTQRFQFDVNMKF